MHPRGFCAQEAYSSPKVSLPRHSTAIGYAYKMSITYIINYPGFFILCSVAGNNSYKYAYGLSGELNKAKAFVRNCANPRQDYPVPRLVLDKEFEHRVQNLHAVRYQVMRAERIQSTHSGRRSCLQLLPLP